MNDTITTEVERYATLARDFAGNLNDMARGTLPDPEWHAEQGLEDDFGYELGSDADYEFTEIINNNALEVYANTRLRPDGHQDIRSIVVVLGTGGPHYEFEVDYRGNVEGRAYWGGDSATVNGHDMEPLAEYLIDIFGGEWDIEIT